MNKQEFYVNNNGKGLMLPMALSTAGGIKFSRILNRQIHNDERNGFMKKFKDTRLHKLIGGKGIYITLGACILAIGGAGVAAYNKAVTRINDNLTFSVPDENLSQQEQQADQKQNDIKKDDDSSLSEELEEILSTQPNVMPVNGEILNPFSNGELVKSDTLEVWKTHDGVDIAADSGSQVKAMNKGEVTKIWEDALWGNCMTIDHGNGIVGHYYNLSSAMMVEEGDSVESGQPVATIGDTAQIEAAQPPHLHFGLKRNGEWIDPITFIDPNSNK